MINPFLVYIKITSHHHWKIHCVTLPNDFTLCRIVPHLSFKQDDATHLSAILENPYYPCCKSQIIVCLFVCFCHVTPPTVLGRLHPDLRHRISMTPISTRVFYLMVVLAVCRRDTNYLWKCVPCSATPGGRGHHKSPPFTVQYSCPHVFQCSELF